jgi:hypothetical protein
MFSPCDTEGQFDYNHSLCQSLGERCEVIFVTGNDFLKEVVLRKNYTVQALLRGILFRK